jgi:Phage gp6-like head-tail connector protein
MADIWVKVLEPATSYALLTLDELKTILGISTSDASEDDQLTMWIEHYSDVVATMCNRVFAKEKVQETWRGDTMPFDSPRLFLTHYPVADADIESVSSPNGTLIDPAAYEVENRSGKVRIDGAWSEPITVVYTGGYDLPEEAPAALKQAVGLLIQGAREQMTTAAISGIKSITHRESRVQFMDTATSSSKTGGGAIGAAADTVDALLYKYMRFYA